DLRSLLKFRELGLRYRWRHAADGLAAPYRPAGIDKGPQLRVEKTVEQTARRQQLGEIVERDVVCGSGTERIPPGNRMLAQIGGTAWRAESLLDLLGGAATADRRAAGDHRLEPTFHRLRRAGCFGTQQHDRVVAGEDCRRRAGNAAGSRGGPFGKLLAQRIDRLQRLRDRRAGAAADIV